MLISDKLCLWKHDENEGGCKRIKGNENEGAEPSESLLIFALNGLFGWELVSRHINPDTFLQKTHLWASWEIR